MSRRTTRGRSSLSFSAPNGVLDMEDILKYDPWKQAERFTETDAGIVQNLLDDFNDIIREIKQSPKECPGRRSGPRVSPAAHGEDEKKPKGPGRGKNPTPANQRPRKTAARKTSRGAAEKTTDTANKAEKHVDHFPGRQRTAARSGRRAQEKNNDSNNKENAKKTIPRARKGAARMRKSCEPMAPANARVKTEPNETVGSEGYHSGAKCNESQLGVVHHVEIKREIKSEPCDSEYASSSNLEKRLQAANLRPEQTSTPKKASPKPKHRVGTREGRIVKKRSASGGSDSVPSKSSRTNNNDPRKTGERDVPVNITRKAAKTRGSEASEKPRVKPVRPKAEMKQEKSNGAKCNYSSNAEKGGSMGTKAIREHEARLLARQRGKINRETLRHERKAARAMEKFSHHVMKIATKMGYFADEARRSSYNGGSSEEESFDSCSEGSYSCTCSCSCSSFCSCSSCSPGSFGSDEYSEYTLNSCSECRSP